MAISKQKKQEIVKQYGKWLKQSQALILTNYIGLTMKDLEELRKAVREAGGEFHIVKNSLVKLAFENANLPIVEENMLGPNAIGFAYEDPPALAKAIKDFAKKTDFLKIKGGYIEDRLLNIEEVNALADLPPIPVMRAILLSTILAPATQLARTIAEPGRQIAAVLKAFSEEAAPETA